MLGEDSAALVGIIIAFLGISLRNRYSQPVLDGAASVLIGLVLIVVAIFLALDSRSLIVGESANAVTVKGIREIASVNEAVVRLKRLLTMHLGPDEVLLTMDIEFAPGLTSAKLARAVDRLERRISEKYPKIKHIYIEAELIKRHLQNEGTS